MATFVYTLQSNGALKVKTTFLPDTSAVTSLARVGTAFEMPYAYNKVSYLGRGEHETYIDRNQSGCIGIYHTDAERMFHYYVKPQLQETVRMCVGWNWRMRQEKVCLSVRIKCFSSVLFHLRILM